jgi:hypothetical protein
MLRASYGARHQTLDEWEQESLRASLLQVRL